MNLLNNAVKYSQPPASIIVTLRETSSDVKIEITDHGIGIPPEDIGYIFNRFYTVNKAHSRSLGGAGIGLAIVKTIVEKHEGTITVTSVFGKGSTFTVTLPRMRQAQV
jgi:two-component system phosphate regulon sensor histidine kinase PhoR